MPDPAPGYEVEIIPERPQGVVCRLRSASRKNVASATVHEQGLPLVSGRRFWVYRAELGDAYRDAEDPMFNAAFEALEREYLSSRSGPLGVCVIVADPEEIRRRPQAIWPATGLFYAGTLPDGAHLRLRYFWDAVIGPGLPNSPTLDETIAQQYPLDERYRIVAPGEAEEASVEEVAAMWVREGAMPEPEAQRRADEVQLVAIEPAAGAVGAATAFLEQSPRLRMPMWFYRTFVAREHRYSSIAAQLIFQTRDLLEHRFVSGEDRRAGGILAVVENEGLRRYFNRALGMPSDFTFIGEVPGGAHVRVHYFPGAEAPGPG